MAMAAFYLKGVQGDRVSLQEIFKGGYPFIFMVIFAMLLLYNLSRNLEALSKKTQEDRHLCDGI